MGKSLRRWDLARSKTSSQVESSAWTSGVIWNTNGFPNPVGRFSKTSLLSMKAFNAFSCSGNSLVTPKTRQAFSMMAFSFSAILDLYLPAQSHSSHSSLLRKCNVHSDWIKFTKPYDVMDTALNKVHQTGKGESAWQKPRTTWTVWESGYREVGFKVRSLQTSPAFMARDPFLEGPKKVLHWKAIAKSRTLWLKSCFIHIFSMSTEVSFIREVTGVYSSLFLDTNELRMALRA